MLTTWRSWLTQAVLILGIGCWIYAPAFAGAWIWDDETYISQNAVITDPAGWWKVWTHADGQGDYYPLTSFVEWIQWHLLGNVTLGYHLTSLALHFISAFLVWWMLARLGLRFAWLGGLLFVVHPMIVESVAWMSELKNTLALAAAAARGAGVAQLARGQGCQVLSHWAKVACFVVSLLVKTSGIMLPVVLLGYAWWKEGNISRQDVQVFGPLLHQSRWPPPQSRSPRITIPGEPKHLQPDWNLLGALASRRLGAVFFLLAKSIDPARSRRRSYRRFCQTTRLHCDRSRPLAHSSPRLAALFCGQARKRAGAGLFLFGIGFFLINLFPVLHLRLQALHHHGHGRWIISFICR